MTSGSEAWPRRATSSRSARWEVALFAICFATSMLVALALFWSGGGTYADLVRTSSAARVELHERWVAYATGREADAPATPALTALEHAHMVDVRAAFMRAQVAAVICALVVVFLLVAARRRRALLARNGASASAIGVAIVAAFAAISFDAAFMLFHRILFPQGNWLFAPDSALLALYPEPYWYGMTLRIAISFISITALVAAIAEVGVRSQARTVSGT